MARKSTQQQPKTGKRFLNAKLNRLRRIIAIQNLYQIHKIHAGVLDSWIYVEHIYPVYYISRTSFYCYLQKNAKKELHDLEATIKNEQCNEHSELKTS